MNRQTIWPVCQRWGGRWRFQPVLEWKFLNNPSWKGNAMEPEESLAARFVVIDTLLAFLLAREAAHQGLDTLHSSMTHEIVQSIYAAGTPESAALAEKLLDNIYRLAGVFLARMKSGAPGTEGLDPP